MIFVLALLVACGRGEPRGAATSDSAENESTVVQSDAMVTSFIVETTDPVPLAGVEAAVADVLTGRLEVAQLFPDTPDLEGMYVIATGRSFSEREAFDVAYRLKDLPLISDAVPNFPLHKPDLPREAAAACKEGDNPDVPDDHGWSLNKMNAQAAWSLEPPEGGLRRGEGIIVCHPDSGWAEHLEYEAEAIVKDRGIDLIDGSGNGRDPLNYAGNPGHGTGTGSVIASRDDPADDGDTDPPGGVVGVAPRSRVLPIRTLKSVVQFLDSDVARAVNYARGEACDVVSMSLGGAGFFGLKKAISRTVERDDKIVIAAAGNCVGFMVAPAKYDTTIAAAASNWNDAPWKGSSKGSAVTITAPGEGVWVARRKKNSTNIDAVESANGTSYATAALAGAAADWIAFHGKDRLNDAKGQHSLTELFRFVLQDAVTKPPGWDSARYGPGILDIEKLLKADIKAFPKDQPRAAGDADTPLATLSRTIDRSLQQTRDVLLFLFGNGDPDSLASTYGTELERIATIRPADIKRILDQVDQRAERSALDSDVAERFSARMRTAAATD
jgi:hypothetical protein